MISNQVLQNTLEGLKEISRTEFCVLDTEGKVLASTFTDFSIATQDVQAFVESQADSQLVKGFQYFKVCDDYQLALTKTALSRTCFLTTCFLLTFIIVRRNCTLRQMSAA